MPGPTKRIKETAKYPLLKLILAGNSSTCLCKFEKQKYRALIDSGAEVSLIHYTVFKSLKQAPKLHKKHVNVQSVSGSYLTVKGYAEMEFELKGENLKHKFYVVDNMNRNLILGRDWMIDDKIRIYYDLGCLRTGNTYVPLLEDMHISSVLRLTADIDLKPQTSTIVHAKARNHPNFPVSEICQVKATEKGIIGQEPGLLVANSVGKLNKNRRIPICLVNNTNKFHRIKRSSVVGTLLSTTTSEIASLDKVISNHKNQSDQTEIGLNSLINVPDEHRQVIRNLITCNRDLFATKDTYLGKTDTIKMKIDTGNHPPIKLKPYRTTLNNIKIVEEAVKDMLDAKIIRKSRSPWAFPVVKVEKKDKTKRFRIDFRKLNNITKKNSFPLPVIDDILAQLGKAKYFTALDLKSGYHQIEMDEKDKEKTAFTCHVGLFEYNKLPFDLANGPSIFQELMFSQCLGRIRLLFCLY